MVGELSTETVYPVYFRLSDIREMPDNEKTFLILSSHYYNSINVLMRLSVVCANHAHDDVVISTASSVTAQMCIRHLGGEIREGAKMLLEIFPEIYERYQGNLSVSAVEAWNKLQIYFSKSNNFVELFRNNIDFHNSIKLTRRAIKAAPEHLNLDAFLCDQ